MIGVRRKSDIQSLSHHMHRDTHRYLLIKLERVEKVIYLQHKIDDLEYAYGLDFVSLKVDALHFVFGEDGSSFRNNPILNKPYNNFRRSYWKWRADTIIGG